MIFRQITFSKVWSLFLLLQLLFSVNAYSNETGCKIHPSQLNKLGTDLVKKYKSENKSFPESVIIQTTIDTSYNGEFVNNGTVEGFFRPNEDDFYPIIPFPILGLYLSRDRNVLYICAHVDPDPSLTHITIYVMRGFHLDRSHVGTIFGNLTKQPSLKVKAAVATLLDLGQVRKFFLKIFNWVPLQEGFFKAIIGFQRMLAQTLGDFTGLGVERIVVTPEYLQLASGVYLNNLDKKPKLTKKIKFLKKKQIMEAMKGTSSEDNEMLEAELADE